jgi:uncharacterized protein (TIGR00299 family) protein
VTKQALLLDPFSGASGDMFLGALLDLGVSTDDLRSVLSRIPELRNVTAKVERVTHGVFSATRVDVACPHEHAHRSLSTIRDVIEKADLKPGVKKGALRTFTRLAEAEAKVHGTDIEAVHFHEVGALDAIYDIVGAHVALDLLGNPACWVRPIVLGAGTGPSAHGEIPYPAPATLELLAGFPVRHSNLAEELVTPTGAAVIASTCRPLSNDVLFTPERVGYGAGARARDGLPNVLRAVLGTLEQRAGHVCVVTTTIDDMNPEIYGYVMEQLFARGVLDVYYSAIMMKKNRPAVEVTIITEERNVYEVARFVMAQTTTLGVRIQREERLELPRRKERVDTPFGVILVKVAEHGDGRETMSPEYESCRAAAEKAGVSLLAVYEVVRRAWDARRPHA